MGKLESTSAVIGTAPINYSQNAFMLNESIGSGEIEGHKFEVHNAWGTIFVTFRDLKGDIPKITLNIRDLVQAAYEAAVNKKLFK